jgi:hypothetical protein
MRYVRVSNGIKPKPRWVVNGNGSSVMIGNYARVRTMTLPFLHNANTTFLCIKRLFVD